MNRTFHNSTRQRVQRDDTLATSLGWFSVALGVAELVAPHRVAHLIGVAPTRQVATTLRAFGARELGNGLGILSQPRNASWMWGRVGGNAIDLLALGTMMQSPRTDTARAAAATAAVLGVTALDILCAQQLSRDGRPQRRFARQQHDAAATQPVDSSRVRVAEGVTISLPLDEVEERWATLESLPESLRNLGRSGSGGDERAIVEFRNAPGDRGTEVRVEMEYSPRGGAIGAAMTRLVGGDPTGRIRQDLQRFKQILETGEVVLSDGPSLWRAAQPAADPAKLRRLAGVEESR